MNAQHSSTDTFGRTDAVKRSETTLQGHWLVLARVGWIVVTVTLVVLNLVALPDTYMAYFHFTPQELQELHRLGLSPTLYSILQIVVNAPFQLVYLALGLLLFLRRSNDRMALFCSFALVTIGNALQLYDFNSGTIVPSLATHAILNVIALLLFAVGEASFVIFFYLFPSGRFAPRWTRWCALVVMIYWLAVVFFPTLPSNAGGLATYLIPLSLISAVVAQIFRYVRISTPRERQQTKWVVFGFTLAILLLVVYILIGFLLPPSTRNDLVLGSLNPIFPIAFLLIAICIVIAVLRSRLWNIDTLINRTLVYGSLTIILALIYFALIFTLQFLLSGIIERNNDVAIVISTLAIYALFWPLRRRIQKIIDRRFYRSKYDATKIISNFNATLRDEVDLNMLQAHLLAVVQETMQPAHVSLWLYKPEQRTQTRY